MRKGINTKENWHRLFNTPSFVKPPSKATMRIALAAAFAALRHISPAQEDERGDRAIPIVPVKPSTLRRGAALSFGEGRGGAMMISGCCGVLEVECGRVRVFTWVDVEEAGVSTRQAHRRDLLSARPHTCVRDLAMKC